MIRFNGKCAIWGFYALQWPCRTILPVVQAEDFCSIACTIGSGKNWIVRQGPLQLVLLAGCSGSTVKVPTPVETVDRFERAQDRLQAGDFDGAMADLDEILARNPDDAAALEDRGLIHLKRNEYKEAIADLERAIVLNPHSPIATNDLAWLLATCPVAEHRNGKRAVELAKLASCTVMSLRSSVIP